MLREIHCHRPIQLYKGNGLAFAAAPGTHHYDKSKRRGEWVNDFPGPTPQFLDGSQWLRLAKHPKPYFIVLTYKPEQSQKQYGH